LAQIREHAEIGSDCVIGRGAYVGPGVRVGDNCKLQNYALVYEPAVLGDGVFVGPTAVLTNDEYPRAVSPAGRLKRSDDWAMVSVVVGDGASIGARAVCVAPVTIGRWALVAAGAVVTRDVPDFALVARVPARHLGWVGPAGVRLTPTGDGRLVCPRTGELFALAGGALTQA
jgi:acetyltransferase-like isoleucine patch superfamily enzyme